MAQDPRAAVGKALEDARTAILSLDLSEIDAQPRADAEDAVNAAYRHIKAGFAVRDHERSRAEAARVYQLYLDGKLVEKNKP